VAIEPYPNDLFMNHIPGLTELRPVRLEEVDVADFEKLDANDILFIDSSHVIKCGNDVEIEYFEIIPRIKPGVIVHVHDIFLPAPYPPNWLKYEHVFWNEQYLLAALLMHSRVFEVLWAGCLIHQKYPEQLIRTIPGYKPDNCLPGSFWFRRGSAK
jgi:hypothetical protein